MRQTLTSNQELYGVSHERSQPDRKALADYMSALSEEAYCAGWMDGLEFALWNAVVRDSSNYGRLRLEPEQINRLRVLSETCGGWIVYDDQEGETWVPTEEWKVIFERDKGSMANKMG